MASSFRLTYASIGPYKRNAQPPSKIGLVLAFVADCFGLPYIPTALPSR